MASYRKKGSCISMDHSGTKDEIELKIEDIIKICKGIEPAVHDLCCIYKAPPHLRKLKDGEAYEPRLITIGPFHQKNSNFQSMNKEKQRYFYSFWERVVTNREGVTEYIHFIQKNTDTICHYYSSPIDKKDHGFVEMILLDSVFIMELFLRNFYKSEQKKDYMLSTSWICNGIQRDLMLLENQLPMFLLKELYRNVFRENCPTFLELAVNYFKDYIPYNSRINPQNKEVMIKKYHSCNHFTDLIRCSYIPKEADDHDQGWKASKHRTPTGGNEYISKTAMRLDEAGVNFEVLKKKGLLEIKFTRIRVMNWLLCLGCIPLSCFKYFQCRLQIPQFKVTQTTECLLRNLIALEECCYSDQPFICSYVFLIDSLINSKEDVAFLVEKEVIVNELGSNHEVADMTNGLCKHVVLSDNYYDRISWELEHHYHNHWKRTMGTLKSVYFRDAWRVSSTIVGIAFFIFAVLNFLRFIGLYKPNHN